VLVRLVIEVVDRVHRLGVADVLLRDGLPARDRLRRVAHAGRELGQDLVLLEVFGLALGGHLEGPQRRVGLHQPVAVDEPERVQQAELQLLGVGLVATRLSIAR
jgi:hypothetical protein